eukprot:11015984-Prorocentrum_lima.AAC.1
MLGQSVIKEVLVRISGLRGGRVAIEKTKWEDTSKANNLESGGDGQDFQYIMPQFTSDDGSDSMWA